MGDDKNRDRRRNLFEILFSPDIHDEKEVEAAADGWQQLGQMFRGATEKLASHTPLARLKRALVWWTTERQFIEDDARQNWEAILASESEFRIEYYDSNHPFASMDKCIDFARNALWDFESEVERFLPDASDRTVDHLAEILHRYHGHKINELIPAAKEARRQASRPNEQVPGSLLQARPKDEQDAIRAHFDVLKTKDAVREHAEQLLAQEREKVAALGLSEEQQRDHMALFESDLREHTQKFCRERGLT